MQDIIAVPKSRFDAREATPAVPTATAAVPSVAIAVGGAVANILLALGCDFFFDDPYLTWVPLVMIATTFVTCVINAVAIILGWRTYLWSPLPWFLGACAVYYGIGPTAYYYASQETVAYMDGFYPADMAMFRKTCVLNSVGILVVCSTWRLALTRWPDWVSVEPRPMTPLELKRLAGLFLVIGLPVKYFFVLPYEFGLTDYVLPGSVQACGNFAFLLLFVSVYLVASGGGGWALTLFTVVFVSVEIVSQVMLFSKQAVIQALVMCFFGVYTARPTRMVFSFFVAFLAASYLVLMPFVSWCRTQSWFGENRGIETRLAIALDYLSRDDRQAMQDTTGVNWSRVRLCSVPLQAFGIDAYDRGNPGESLWLGLYVFIPRFLWAEKPIISIGETYNLLATGSADNQTSPGLWADAYWNGGWLAVVVACTYLGILHALITRIVVPAMKVQDFRVLPVAFFGLIAGLRVEGFFVLTAVAPVPICALYFLVVRKLC